MPIDYENWDLSTKELMIISLGVLAGGMGIGWLFFENLKFGLLFAVAIIPAKNRYKAWMIKKRKDKLRLEFKDLLYSIASSVSVGRSMTQAMKESLEFWKGTYSDTDYIMIELSHMIQVIESGNERDVVVLKDFAGRSGAPDICDFVAVYENCRQSGADLVKAIDKASEMIGEKIRLERELVTLLSQKKFEGKVITMAPFGLMLCLRMIAPDYLAPLTTSPTGYFISMLALALIAAAYILMERINCIEI